MSYPEYKRGVVDCTTTVDYTNVKGKSVVVTGGRFTCLKIYCNDLIVAIGAGGMGEQTVRLFVKAG